MHLSGRATFPQRTRPFLFSGQTYQFRDGCGHACRLSWFSIRRYIAKINVRGIPRDSDPHPSKKVFQKLALSTSR